MFLRPKSWFCIRLPNIEQASIKKVDSTKNISDRPLSEIGRKLVRELSFETTPVRRTVNLLARKDDHQSGGFRFVKNKGKEFAKALKGTTATTAMAVASTAFNALSSALPVDNFSQCVLEKFQFHEENIKTCFKIHVLHMNFVQNRVKYFLRRPEFCFCCN